MIKTIFVLMILVPNIAYSYDEYLSNSEVQEFIEHMHEKYDYDKKKLTPTSLKKSKDDTKKLLNLNDDSITTEDNTIVIKFRTQSFDSL